MLRQIRKTAGSSAEDHRLILIQDAVLLDPPEGVKAYVLGEDADRAGVRTDLERIDYPAMVDLIFESDSVITW